MHIKEFLACKKYSNKVAISDGNLQLSYSEFYKKAFEVHEKLDEVRSNSGRSIGIYLPNGIEYSVAYFGVALNDGVIVPIHPLAKEKEMRSTIEYCELRVIITNREYKERLIDMTSEFDYSIVILEIDELALYRINDNKKSVPLSNQKELEDVAIMLHTSGTTSNPKRVMLTHDNLYSNIKSNIESLDLKEQDKTLITLPMCFGYCNTAQFLTHIFLGATVVILKDLFTPRNFFQIVERMGITNYTGVPSSLLMLSQYRHLDRYNLSTLRFICFGGGVMPVNKLKQLVEMFPTIPFLQTYGQTEASPRLTLIRPEDYLRKIGSVGKSIPNVKIKIINEKAEEINEPFKIGKIVASGSNVMKGYYKNKEITDKTIIDGWLYTGDIGHYDDEGYLYIEGREKNIIISGGYNIYPEEIEELLLGFKGIKNAMVIGEEDEFLQEKIVAYITLTNQNDIFEIELLDFYCRNNLAQYKVPKEYYILDELDTTISGKVKRNQVCK